jgi:heme oxygenase
VTTDPLAQLRHATAAAHARLHHEPTLARLAAGEIDRAGYVALLHRLLGYHEAVEARLLAAPPLDGFGIDLAERRRSPLLRADLAMLGETVPAAPRLALPALTGIGQALGWLYVAEGSTLGGRELARALDHLLPLGTAGRRFLLGYGESHGAMWRGCCAALRQAGADAATLDGMLAGAAEAFAEFEALFVTGQAAA